MTDRDRMVELLLSFGMVQAPWEGWFSIKKNQFAVAPGENGSSVAVGGGEGYHGFVCAFSFDAGGDFAGQACWE